MAEGGLLGTLIITEKRDKTEDVTDRGGAGGWAVTAPSALKTERKAEDQKEDNTASQMFLEEPSRGKQEADAGASQTGLFNDEDRRKDDKPEETKTKNGGCGREIEGQPHEVARIYQKPEHPSDREDEKVTQRDPKRLNPSEEQPEGTESQEGDPKKAHRLTPDFPEALYELLCTLQEGRRLNDQRCSFMLEKGVGRRRCHSEPNTNKPAHRVIFSSMTSLQREEFFELVATAQARRLNDQRAQLERSPAARPKGRSFRGSLKQLSFVKKPVPAPAPAPVPKEDLYNMILTTQAQGRLEDQRSRAPGPMDDEDFFSLLLKVQGGRMDEQRTELPCMLQT